MPGKRANGWIDDSRVAGPKVAKSDSVTSIIKRYIVSYGWR
jgi:hypothetical protein